MRRVVPLCSSISNCPLDSRHYLRLVGTRLSDLPPTGVKLPKWGGGLVQGGIKTSYVGQEKKKEKPRGAPGAPTKPPHYSLRGAPPRPACPDNPARRVPTVLCGGRRGGRRA